MKKIIAGISLFSALIAAPAMADLNVKFSAGSISQDENNNTELFAPFISVRDGDDQLTAMLSNSKKNAQLACTMNGKTLVDWAAEDCQASVKYLASIDNGILSLKSTIGQNEQCIAMVVCQ